MMRESDIIMAELRALATALANAENTARQATARANRLRDKRATLQVNLKAALAAETGKDSDDQ